MRTPRSSCTACGMRSPQTSPAPSPGCATSDTRTWSPTPSTSVPTRTRRRSPTRVSPRRAVTPPSSTPRTPPRCSTPPRASGSDVVIDPFIPTRPLADRRRRHTARRARQRAWPSRRRPTACASATTTTSGSSPNTVEGRPVYDLFVERLAPEVVLEVDTFWATVAGADVPAVLRSLGDRVVAIHVKDGKVTGDIATALPSSDSALVVPDALRAAFEEQTPAGQGDVDVPAILAAAPTGAPRRRVRLVQGRRLRGCRPVPGVAEGERPSGGRSGSASSAPATSAPSTSTT